MKNPIVKIAVFFALVATGSLYADPVGTYGDTTIVTGPDSQPAWQLSSVTPGLGYAGVYISPLGLTPDTLTELSAEYLMTVGTFGPGAPRFSIIDTTNNTYNEAYVYFGTPGGFTDPNFGGSSYANTGNYADLLSSDARVQINGFGGVNTGYSYLTWAQFLSTVGTTQIGYITIDLDAGFAGNQVMDIGNFDVNGTLYAPQAPSVPDSGATLPLFGLGFLSLAVFSYRRARLQVSQVAK